MDRRVLFLLLFAIFLSHNSVLGCYCEQFTHYFWDFGSSTNISLVSTQYLEVGAFTIYHCEEKEVQWEIIRADGEVEIYSLHHEGDYNHSEDIREYPYPLMGLQFYILCDYICLMLMELSPVDMRYNGAQVICSFSLPECYNISNDTAPTTIHIQGILEAPTDVRIEASGERVIVSWSPPFTLGGVPILHYSVYITSQGVSEQRNTTETHISLERPCASTTYQISAWNEVGEGNATRKAFLTVFEAAVKVISELLKPGICLSCSFFSYSTADGCTVQMENDKHVFAFNSTRSNNNDDNLVLLESFSVPEAGEYSVSVHEIHDGVEQEHVSIEVNNITVWITKNSSLIYSNVKPVSERICAFCVFTNGSNAKGCAIILFSDKITLNFAIPRHSTYDIALVECFKVWQSGSYHVLVSEILMDGSEGYNKLELPDVTIALASATDNTSKQENGTPTVTGLSAVLGLTLMGLFIVVLLAFIFYLKRRSTTKRKNNECTTEQQTGVAVPLYENTQLVQQPPPPSVTDGGDHMYEHVELRPITGQDKEIAVAPNAAYGTVRR